MRKFLCLLSLLLLVMLIMSGCGIKFGTEDGGSTTAIVNNTTTTELESSSNVRKDTALSDTTTIESESSGSDNEIMSIFHEVLIGKRDFVNSENNKKSNTKSFNYFNGDTEENIKWEKFALIDMDGDGIKEVVIELLVRDAIEMVEVLRYYDGEVYGYQFGSKSLSMLKKDATFDFTGGAAYNGVAVLEFDGAKYNYVELAITESFNNPQRFLINEEEVSEDEFIDFWKEQHGKEDVEWHDFTEENINRFVR